MRPGSTSSPVRRFRGLADLNLTPSVQSIPTTLAGVNALSGRAFTEWYVGNMVGGNWVGANGTTLVAAGAPRYGRVVPGWNGADYTNGYRAVEFDGSTAAFNAGTTALYDASTSLTFVVGLRMLRATGVAQNLIAKKLNFAATSPGYTMYFGATGNVGFAVANGAAQVEASTVATAAELDRVTNGALHWIAGKINLTAGTVQMLAYRASGTPVALPVGPYTTANGFKIGFATFLNSALNCQVVGWGVLTGAEAEAFDLAALNAIDNWCRPPSGTTFLRHNNVAPIVGSDATGVRVQHCAGSATTAAMNHFAHAFAAACTAPGQVGALCERGIESVTSFECRNRLLNTDDLANASFTKTNIAATANLGEDPAGFTGAARLTASAVNGICFQNFTGQANSDHTISVFAQRNQGTDVAARLQLVNSATSAEIAGVNIMIGALRERFSLTVPGATIGAVTTLRWQLRINTGGHAIFATFAQAEYGWLRAYQPQRAALVSRDQNEWTIDNADGSKLDIIAGRVEVTCTGLVETVNSTGAFVWSTDAGASNEDRIFQQRDALASTYPNDTQHYDSAGVLVAQMSDQPILPHTNEITYRYEWDSRRPIRNDGSKARARAEVGGTVVRTGAVVPSAPWPTGTNADRIFLGSRHSFSAHLEGVITRVRTWGRAS